MPQYILNYDNDHDDTNNNDPPTLPPLSDAPNNRLIPCTRRMHFAMFFLIWFTISSQFPSMEISR
jgi:hypothetical protein